MNIKGFECDNCHIEVKGDLPKDWIRTPCNYNKIEISRDNRNHIITIDEDFHFCTTSCFINYLEILIEKQIVPQLVDIGEHNG